MAYSEKLKDPRWQKKSLEIFQRDNFTCQSCSDYEKTLNVHHLKYSGNDPWETESIYLITLCEDCHAHETENYKKSLALFQDAIIRSGALSNDLDSFSDKILSLLNRGNFWLFEPNIDVLANAFSHKKTWDICYNSFWKIFNKKNKNVKL